MTAYRQGMFKLIGWGVAYPLLAVAVAALTWVGLELAFEPRATFLLVVIGFCALGASFLALMVGYMLRDPAERS